MSRQQRPVYICDKCGKESLEKRDVRKIIGNISDGEGEHNYVGDNFIRTKKGAISTNIEIDRTIGDTKIASNMYCLECLPKVLKIDETKTERKAVDLLKERVQLELPEKILENAKKEVEEEKRRTSIVPEIFEDESIDDDFDDTSNKLDDILNVFDDEKEDETSISKTDDFSTSISNIGQYHVLAMITDEESEEIIAKFYKFENVEDMRSPYGGPLIGVYATRY